MHTYTRTRHCLQSSPLRPPSANKRGLFPTNSQARHARSIAAALEAASARGQCHFCVTGMRYFASSCTALQIFLARYPHELHAISLSPFFGITTFGLPTTFCTLRRSRSL